MPVKVNRQNIGEHLFEYQLSMIGKTPKDALEHGPQWRETWHWPDEYAQKFRAYAIPLIKKTFKCSKGKAEKTLDYFLVNYGLKIYK